MSMSDTIPTSKSQAGGLRSFGGVEIALGVLAALLAGVSLLAVFFTAGTEPATQRMMIPGVLTYLALAVYFVTLGVGSWRGRRWARALALATGWIGLATGLAMALTTALIMPRTLETIPGATPGLKWFIAGCMSAVILVFLIILPAAMILFHRRAAVRETVEQMDPVPRWTDRLPTSVIAFALLWGWVSVASLTSSFAYRALPIGGIIIGGAGATALMLVSAAAAFWVTWGTIHLQRAAWWTALVLLLLGAAVTFWMIPRVDFAAWYAAMELPMDPMQIELLEDLYGSPAFIGLAAVLWLGYFGWLLWIRRYFFRNSEPGDDPLIHRSQRPIEPR
jgi:hypothetical protein